MCTFYLGTHLPSWLARTTTPLFISHRRLIRIKTLPQARGHWALDSGGFSELSLFGYWETSPAAYVAAVQRYRDEIGNLDWAACQDWMCEPIMLKRTGLSIADHQQRTIASYLDLMGRDSSIPWIPVLQGWILSDYEHHLEQYARVGIDLACLPRVGLGSVCRRQGSPAITTLIQRLSSYGLKLHGFGVKTQGLSKSAYHLTSADSMAWSYDARRSAPLPGHTHKNCANCLEWALRWEQHTIQPLLRPRYQQQVLF